MESYPPSQTSHQVACRCHRWGFFENAFALWYANKGRLAISIRVMVGWWILKRLDHLGDETLMERWIENPP